MRRDSRWDIVSLGEPLVEFGAVPGTRRYELGYGGDTSNCVIAAARLGARCAYVSQVGDDEFGADLLALWRREDVCCDGVRTLEGAPTGLYFVHHGPSGHRFTYRRAGSAASRITPDQIPGDLIRESAWLHVSGISMAISASARKATLTALRVAADAGVATSFDLNHRPALSSPAAARADAHFVLEGRPIFFVSLDEARVVLQLDTPELVVRWALDRGARAALVKLGPQGCLVGDADRMVRCEGWRVHAVDATGAGDCFAGACLARLAAGDSLWAAARFANVAAALSTRGYGAVNPLPRTADVLEALQGDAASGGPA